MKILRLGLPIVVAMFALAGAATSAFAAGHPADAALTPASSTAQEAGDAAVDVRPDRSDGKHRLAALCRRLYNSDHEAPALRARCAEIFGDELPDSAALGRRAHDANANRDVAGILERCREHLGDATDSTVDAATATSTAAPADSLDSTTTR